MDKPSRINTDTDMVSAGKRSGHFRLPYSSNRSAYGYLPIPFTVVANSDGPTVLLMGAVHGDEFEGPIALSRFARDVEAEDIVGRIIIVPAINPSAFADGKRLSPVDDLNLNRIFPGNRDGSVSEILADFVERELLAIADYVVDFHSGGTSLEYIPLVQIPQSDDDAEIRKAAAIAHAFGAPVSIYMDLLAEDRTVAAAAKRTNTFWLCPELGGAAQVSREGVRIGEQGLRRFLRHIGSLRDGGSTEPDIATRILAVGGAAHFLFAPCDGIFEPCFTLGDMVTEGMVAGYVHRFDAIGSEPIELRWRAAGTVLCRRPVARVQAGDCVGHLAA
ncbi:succinylglutamate desuccinylase [Nostoc sp. 3335mG]|nr:succinylglutamate desuccinylase [Nostoc sp. 3335mG]